MGPRGRVGSPEAPLGLRVARHGVEVKVQGKDGYTGATGAADSSRKPGREEGTGGRERCLQKPAGQEKPSSKQ